MNDLLIAGDISRGLLSVRSARAMADFALSDAEGREIEAPVLRRLADPTGGATTELDARNLKPWSPDSPCLYHLTTEGQTVRFGYVDIRPQDTAVLVNGTPFYFRGYIRGIMAHDHPNLTGLSKREFHRKSIQQARKYGFNLVRFHSTIPEVEFVEQADELGLFVHLELGYDCQYNDTGERSKIVMDRDKWRDMIIRFRNHPSVLILCLGNEMHNAGRNAEVHELVEVGRSLAPNKLIMDNAGWGEFDRTCADVFAQHIAYYFPFKRHAGMFDQDGCWEKNGSMHEVPVSVDCQFRSGTASIRRRLNPIRPVIAHEALHYIDIPDYIALNRRYDEFASRVGEDYLDRHAIKKPRYLTNLPALIAAKKLEDKMPDYILASQHFKKLAIKTYLERLRLCDTLCGYEMLQLSDSFKYENKNGIIDFFDDDKFMDAAWMRQFNSNLVLLADFPKENFLAGEMATVSVHLSNYVGEVLHDCELTLHVAAPGGRRELLYRGEHFTPVRGLSKLVDLRLALDAPESRAAEYTLEAELTGRGHKCRNEWKFWVYPPARLDFIPELRLSDPALKEAIERLAENGAPNPKVLFCDLLDDSLLAALDSGKTVILNYHRDRTGNQYYLPGALDRFKPCIWDRGNHLGGVVAAEWLREAMGSGRYFDRNFYALVEGGYKVNLDRFPCKVSELVWGVDKPVRDRMRVLMQGVNNFVPEHTLRNFSYLFAVRAGAGLLIVCTFNLSSVASDPAVGHALCALLRAAPRLETQCAIGSRELRAYLREATEAGVVNEDVMNRFWELDNKPVEDRLFWEEAGVDLRILDMDPEQ